MVASVMSISSLLQSKSSNGGATRAVLKLGDILVVGARLYPCPLGHTQRF